jgi:hypothetical protein
MSKSALELPRKTEVSVSGLFVLGIDEYFDGLRWNWQRAMEQI